MADTPSPQRFVALDVHKQYVVVAAVNSGQQLVLPPRRIDLDRFDTWITQHLLPTDALVLEATTNAWHLYDQLEPLVSSVTVAHPLKVTLISQARVKTDSRDTITLARLLAAGLVPQVWVPPKEVRELRALVAHRQRLIRQRTQARNRLLSVLHRYNLRAPKGNLFSGKVRDWWLGLDLPGLEKLRVRQDLAILDSLEPLIEEVEDEFLQLSTSEPWADQLPFVVQLPGMGVVNALILLAAIGDITRFPSAKQLVGYAGLGAAVHSSGQTYRTGRITKQGRREMRTALIEAAWVTVERHPYWKAQFKRLTAAIGKPKAIVAIARKLLVVLWHVLTERAADRHAIPVAVARKFMRWGARRGVAVRQGVSRAAFVRQRLSVLGLGGELTSFAYGDKQIRLPAAESVGGSQPVTAVVG